MKSNRENRRNVPRSSQKDRRESDGPPLSGGGIGVRNEEVVVSLSSESRGRKTTTIYIFDVIRVYSEWESW